MKDKYPNVNRVEVIDQQGRAFVGYFDKNGADISIQDEGRTIKVFMNGAKIE